MLLSLQAAELKTDSPAITMDGRYSWEAMPVEVRALVERFLVD